MEYISEIEKVRYNLRKNIEENIKAEELGGPFDDSWVKEMQMKKGLLVSLGDIIDTYNWIIEQDNK